LPGVTSPDNARDTANESLLASNVVPIRAATGATSSLNAGENRQTEENKTGENDGVREGFPFERDEGVDLLFSPAQPRSSLRQPADDPVAPLVAARPAARGAALREIARNHEVASTCAAFLGIENHRLRAGRNGAYGIIAEGAHFLLPEVYARSYTNRRWRRLSRHSLPLWHTRLLSEAELIELPALALAPLSDDAPDHAPAVYETFGLLVVIRAYLGQPGDNPVSRDFGADWAAVPYAQVRPTLGWLTAQGLIERGDDLRLENGRTPTWRLPGGIARATSSHETAHEGEA
jgi:hypothetical protein